LNLLASIVMELVSCVEARIPIPPERMEAIPEWFWIPQPAKLDKRALLETLKAGSGITGAQLANQQSTLSIRTR
jgi:hypothetical protein